MIKKSLSLVAIFIISMTIGTSQLMAQKQDRVGKLLKFLSDNEIEKFQKGREKLDEKTAQTVCRRGRTNGYHDSPMDSTGQ